MDSSPPNLTVASTPQTLMTIDSLTDPPPSPTVARRSRRKRSQKEANIGENLPENNFADNTATSHISDGEKRRKTDAPPITSTPISTQTTYSFDFTAQVPPHPPLMEDSFNPQSSPGATPSLPLQINEPDPDITISEANSSLSLNTSQSRSVTTLKNRLIAAKERGIKTNTNSTSARDPLNKYTKGNMPDVYYSHPTAALDFIDIDQVGDWENLPDGKLLAHPFGHEVRSSESHQMIKANLFAAIIEITESETIGVCSPRPCASGDGIPTVFLIYNISELHRLMLLKREVWSSAQFTFRVTTLDPVPPDYLFGITALTVKSSEEVKVIVRAVWDSKTTTDFIQNTINTFPAEMRASLQTDTNNFSKSMNVKKMDTKKIGGTAAPTFNVYADGKLINDDDLWCLLRNFLTAQNYAFKFQDPGRSGTDLHRCSICQSIEHPRGLCPFPNVKGWNGPFWDDPDDNKKRGDNNRKYWPAKPRKGLGLTYQ